MQHDQKNLFIALALSLAILIGFQYFYEAPRQQKQQEILATQKAKEVDEADIMAINPNLPENQTNGSKDIIDGMTRAEVIAYQKQAAKRVDFDTPSISGSLSTKGARIDDLTLKNYKVTTDPDSPNVELLSPSGSKEAYFIESNWLSNDTSIKLPTSDTIWSANKDTLDTSAPVILTYDNGQGVTFQKVISLDENYMFTVTQRIINKSGKDLNFTPYSVIARHNPPPALGFYILHEGPIGVLDGSLKESKYKDLDENQTESFKSNGGWIGMTDKYWLVALIPDQKDDITARFVKNPNKNNYQTDFMGKTMAATNGSQIEYTMHAFAGAKKIDLLDQYETDLSIPDFDKAIDFGWFYFLTKPFFYALKYIAGLVGNFGIAILIFTVIVKAALYPLANKSYQSMSKMKKLQPKMTELREKCGDDRMKLNQEMMELYKKEKVNPASGCLPILVQIPIFFALYKVLFVTIEMRQAPFFGWIHDLSAPDPTTLFNLFGLIPWTPPSFLMIGIWPLIMGFTMYLQQKLNPAPVDPVQQKVFMVMPFMFTFLLASFPAGLVIYWAWNNLLSIVQQWSIMKKMKAI